MCLLSVDDDVGFVVGGEVEFASLATVVGLDVVAVDLLEEVGAGPLLVRFPEQGYFVVAPVLALEFVLGDLVLIIAAKLLCAVADRGWSFSGIPFDLLIKVTALL